MLRKLYSLLIVSLILASGSAFAQSGAGTLKGTVKDKKTGEPLPFANVVVLSGETQVGGGSTDFDGKYSIKPIPPGKYNVKVVFVGYNPQVISGVVIQGGKIAFQDLTLESGVNLDEVLIVEYVQPLIDRDGGSSGGTVSRSDIDKMSARSATAVASTVGGISSAGQADGAVSVRGARSENTFFYIDGIKVRGTANLPKSAIEEVSVITGGIPANYGDATGGIISITTRGAASTYFGGIDILSSGFKSGDDIIGLDAFGRTQIEGYLSGPLLWKKNDEGEKDKPLLGFFLSGNYRKFEDPRPSVVGHYYLTDEAQAELEAHPAIFETSQEGSITAINAAEFLSDDSFVLEDAARNSDQLGVSLTGKLDLNLNENATLSFGGTGDLRDNNDFLNNTYTGTTSLANVGAVNRIGSLFNASNNASTVRKEWRAFARFTQRFTAAEDSKIKNAFYTLAVDYNKTDRITQDRRHEDNFFDYGYVGKFIEESRPSFGFTAATPDRPGFFWEQSDSVQVVGFEAGTANPILANVTSEFMDLALAQSPNGIDFEDAQTSGVINGETIDRVYGLWTNVGTPSNFYINQDRSQFRVTASGSADVGDHAITLGLEYEQRNDRSFSSAPVGLWERMNQLVNRHILEVGGDSIFVNQGDPGNPTNGYAYLIEDVANLDNQSTFDRNLRLALGLDPDGLDLINIHSIDPELLNMDMFSADDLLSGGSNLVNYFGYDHKGDRLTSEPSLEDYFNEVDENGTPTRRVGSFNPVYISGYIMDKFAFDDIIFNVGVRVDRFDANQKVLRDEYVVGDFHTAGELWSGSTRFGSASGSRPSNISDDHVVYVNQPLDPTAVTGYRLGDDWFNSSGGQSSPNELGVGTTSYPLIVDPGEGLNAQAFEDYDPAISVMPRVAFSFPISDEAVFFAHFDILTQRPTTGVRLELQDYRFIQSQTAVINNANLQPTKTIDYELGFQQVLSKSSSLKISAFYRDMRDMIQVRSLPGAWPEQYVTYRNIDFGTVKGLTLGYDLRRTGNLRMNANYTLQFANGTGSNATGGLNLANSDTPNLQTVSALDFDQRHAINLTIDYRYGSGSDYNGPVWFGKQFFANTGINLISNLGSGTPYSATDVATSILNGRDSGGLRGSVNGSRLPAAFTMNAQIDKNINLKFGKEKDSDKAKTANMNIYLLINNLLNSRNVRTVYQYTGSAEDDGYLATNLAQTQVNEAPDSQAFVDQYNYRLNNPYNYGLARTISLGLKLDF